MSRDVTPRQLAGGARWRDALARVRPPRAPMSESAGTWTPPISTALLIQNWSLGRDPLGWEVEQLVLRRIVDTRICPLCDAGHGDLCRIYGGPPNLRRTHDVRLRLTRGERNDAVRWALTEMDRRRLLDDEDVA